MTLSTRPSTGDAGLRSTSGGLRGPGVYVPPASVAAGKILTAEIIDSTGVRVSVDKVNVPAHPTAGAWLSLTLTYNPQGDPVTNLDGQVIGRYDTEVIDGWKSVAHRPLLPGRWAHYSLFAQYSFGGALQWHRVATASVLVPGDFNYGRRLFTRMPRWYQDADDATVEHLVARFLNAVGTEVDITRSWIETLGDVWDAERVPAKLLEPLSNVLGLRYERTVGDPRVRKLLANLVYLRKTKGTRESIEGYLSALSGYSVLTHQSLNIMLTVEDGEFRSGVGNWVGTTDSTITRTSSVDAGAPPSPQGVLEVQRSSASGIASAESGPAGVPTRMVALDAGTARSVSVSLNARGVSGALSVVMGVQFCDVVGQPISTVSSAATALSTAFGRVWSGWLAVPDTAVYARLIVSSSAAVALGAGFQFGQVMFVDRRWRPEYIPGYTNAEPFSVAGSASYTGVDFYDSPRSVWLNVFPQRTNFAVNSDFTLNNLPVGGWDVADAPSYELLPYAYATYGDVLTAETDYNDLLGEFDSLLPTWTITFNTAAKRLELNSSASSPFVGQVRSKEFPVLPGAPYCASVDLRGVSEGTKATLRIEWMAKANSFEPLKINGVTQVAQGATFDLFTGHAVRVDIRNAIPPEGAGWGRLVIESFNIVQHVTHVQRALIEDGPVPGPYFNGDDVDGAPGDFGYTGTAQQSTSVYYTNFTSVVGSSSNRILSAAKEILPLHLGDPRITTAYEGLYTDLA